MKKTENQIVTFRERLKQSGQNLNTVNALETSLTLPCGEHLRSNRALAIINKAILIFRLNIKKLRCSSSA